MRPITLNIQSSLNNQVQPNTQIISSDQSHRIVSQEATQEISYQNVEVTGIVTSISFSQKRGDPTHFKIYCTNMGETFDAECTFYCPVRQGDTIYALCNLGTNGKLYINKPPFAQLAFDRDSLIQCFMKAVKQQYKPAIKMYDIIRQIAGHENLVAKFLTDTSQSWNDTKNINFLHMFNGIDSDDIKKLLNWWHRERNLRRLKIFGLNDKEIDACHMTCDEIFTRCMENPYTLPAISLEKCEIIIDTINGRPDDNNKFRGAVIRYIWKKLYEFGWTCTPTRFLSRDFPGIKHHVNELKQNYGMVAELETVYLTYPHRVETFIANYIINMVRSDPIKYDTPLDTPITLENGQVIVRHSADFTRSLSEDQRKAVQGALDHKLCIVTGAAGAGKCVRLGTLIIMFDGSIKKIEEIKEGEYIMGPDSRPRKVLSKCYGIDNMFEVIPSKGRSYIFNTPHVLTLKGIQPYLKIINDRKKCYIAFYSEKGIMKEKTFSTEKEAQKFINDLKEDIFDIPLNEFMLRPPHHQIYSYLFHVGVSFPEREVPIDPYMIGFWLGDVTSAYPEITTTDQEVIDYFHTNITKIGLQFNKRDEYHYTITSVGRQCGVTNCNKFLDTLRDLDMLNNKYIPDIYKINSRENRLKLLAGLIDSDSYAYQGCIEITQKNKRLADDIEYLAFSLGFMVTRTECEKECEYENGHESKGEMKYSTYQHMTIFGEGLEEIPVILSRKKSLPQEIKNRATCLRFQINPIGKEIYCGFELDGDGRFLLGDFLVTHNTTCLGQIVHNLELRGISYAVGSFMGKAVARIREVTKKKNPSTLHRLIANTRKNRSDKKSTHIEKDIPPTDYDVIIIDEASTVTTELLYDFLQAYPKIQRLILIGDVNQLSPIGWGSLLHQMMKSETIPTYRLTTNYRVYCADGERDGIILNANAIISHDPQYLFEYVSTSNFSVIEGPIERVYDIIRGCFAGGVKPDKVVIITPYNNYLGVLNSKFQEIYNVGSRSVTDSRGTKWMIDDRVMLKVNDQEIGVFNGESGTIIDITDKAILVDFGQSGRHEFLLEPIHNEIINNVQTDNFTEGNVEPIDNERTVKRLIHSFALTVDKSQGSEWDFVIFYIPEFNTGSFVNKNRVYTALTRAKRCVWVIVPDTDAFAAASIKSPSTRYDNLARRLSCPTNGLSNLKPFRLPCPIPLLEMNGDLPMMPEEFIPNGEMDTGFDCDDFD